jgi:hypothetical protein
MILTAQTILEVATKTAAAVTSLDLAIEAISALLPATTTFADRLKAEYRHILNECVGFYTPSTHETRTSAVELG